MSRLYQPGRKDGNGRSKRPSGGYSAVPRGRQLQLDFYLGLIVIDKTKDPGREGFEEESSRLFEEGAEDAELYAKYGNLESGEAVWFGWTTQPEGRVIRVQLTRCTEEELLAARDAFNRAVEEALPEVRRRDEEARHAEAAGFYGLYRLTRAAPQIIDFARKKLQHKEGVRGGRQAPDYTPSAGYPGASGPDVPSDPAREPLGGGDAG